MASDINTSTVGNLTLYMDLRVYKFKYSEARKSYKILFNFATIFFILIVFHPIIFTNTSWYQFRPVFMKINRVGDEKFLKGRDSCVYSHRSTIKLTNSQMITSLSKIFLHKHNKICILHTLKKKEERSDA